VARRAISPEARKAGAAAFAGAISVAALGLAAAAGPTDPPPARSEPAREPVEIQLLGVNDFHGHLESPKRNLGGAAILDAHLDKAERTHPGHTIRVHAGDMVGASPMLSSYFHDEPSVRAMNLMEFDVGTIGNHEFDEGGDEMVRLLRGGQRRDGLQFKRDEHGRRVNTSAPDFSGVRFPYIAANTIDHEGKLRLPPTRIIERAGVRIGFIGVTTHETPDYLLARHKKRFSFLDISDTVNRYAAELQRQSVEAIVVLAHSGAKHEHKTSGEAAGEIIDEARDMTGAVDVVIAGHTHSYLNTLVPNRTGGGNKLVIEARSLGISYDRVRMTIDPATGDVIDKTGETPYTPADEVTADPETGRLVSSYAKRIAPLANRVVGRARRPLVRNLAGKESGSLVAVAARAQRRLASADIAVVNEGNARASVNAGPITYSELFEASAYEHQILRMELTGREIRALQAQQTALDPDVMLQWSGLPLVLDPNRTYTVAANELLVEGTDDFSVLQHGRHVKRMGTDLEALVRYVTEEETVG
jgi:5'-nucleotidase